MINNKDLFVQANGDVGDAANRTGLAAALYGLLGNRSDGRFYSNRLCNVLEVEPGVYIRHPGGYEPSWSNNPNCFSRDQASRVILAYAINGKRSAIRRWFKTMVKRKFFHQNTLDPVTNEKKFPDIMAPGEWRNVIRGLGLWWGYPLLLLLDLLFIPDILLRKKWDGASLIVPDIYYATKKYPTPGAFIAKYMVKKLDLLSEIMVNHSEEENGCVELQPLFKALLEK